MQMPSDRDGLPLPFSRLRRRVPSELVTVRGDLRGPKLEPSTGAIRPSP